jgi:hypothetical protein
VRPLTSSCLPGQRKSARAEGARWGTDVCEKGTHPLRKRCSRYVPPCIHGTSLHVRNASCGGRWRSTFVGCWRRSLGACGACEESKARSGYAHIAATSQGQARSLGSARCAKEGGSR